MPGKTNLQVMIQTRNDNKKAKSDAMKRGHCRNKENNNVKAGFNPPLKWERLDRRGNPLISFNMKNGERKKLLRIIEADETRKGKVVRKLQSEFIRLYTRYRKAILRESGTNREYVRYGFSVKKSDEHYGASAAILCVKHEITPTNLFRFWHNRVVNIYGGKTMQIPHLPFLASEYAIITAAKADEEEIEKPAEEVIESIFGSDYSQLNKLDPRIRARLLNSKHGDFGFNDRELLSVQMAARALASGCDVFIDDTIIDAAKYLARTLYSDIGKNGN